MKNKALDKHVDKTLKDRLLNDKLPFNLDEIGAFENSDIPMRIL
jgi:hypothetical protein